MPLAPEGAGARGASPLRPVVAGAVSRAVDAGGAGSAPASATSDSRERMLRELAGALEAIAADAVLVLVVEELQWSDVSTLEVISLPGVTAGSGAALGMGTYRPVEMVMSGHPLRRIIQDLHGQRQCQELTLELLTQEEVETICGTVWASGPTWGS